MKNCGLFFFQLVKNSGCSYNGKSGNSHLLLSDCRYFDRSFTEMLLDLSFTLHMEFVQTAECDQLPWQPKIFSSEAIRGMKLKLSINVHNISFYKNSLFFFYYYY